MEHVWIWDFAAYCFAASIHSPPCHSKRSLPSSFNLLMYLCTCSFIVVVDRITQQLRSWKQQWCRGSAGAVELFVYLVIHASFTSTLQIYNWSAVGMAKKRQRNVFLSIFLPEKRSHQKHLCCFKFLLLSYFPLITSFFLSLQYHPLSLCNTSEDERQESDFITIVKLEHRVPRCLPLLDKVRPDTALRASCISTG